jgi:hypothetical protein
MFETTITFFTIAFILSLSAIFAADPCRFEYPEKGVIDLTSLGRTDGKPTYADRLPTTASAYKYSYNPCKPFSEGNFCENVAACQVGLDGEHTTTLGTQESASWNPGTKTNDSPSIIYTEGDRKVIVILQCSTSGTEQFEVLGEDPIKVYVFRLTHKCACWNGCSGIPSNTTTIAPTTSSPTMNACRFEYAGKGVINFSFIGRTDDKAAYTDETTRTVSNFKYSYNPCRSFSQGANCIGVAVCQISIDGQQTIILGKQESASWNPGSILNDLPSINYVYADKNVNVLLQCSTEGNNEFEAFGENPINTYKFRLTHKCACWNGC